MKFEISKLAGKETCLSVKTDRGNTVMVYFTDDGQDYEIHFEYIDAYTDDDCLFDIYTVIDGRFINLYKIVCNARDYYQEQKSLEEQDRKDYAAECRMDMERDNV
jgi:hypothetical protein